MIMIMVLFMLHSPESDMVWYRPVIRVVNCSLLDELHCGSGVRHDQQLRGRVGGNPVLQASVCQLLHCFDRLLVSRGQCTYDVGTGRGR